MNKVLGIVAGIVLLAGLGVGALVVMGDDDADVQSNTGSQMTPQSQSQTQPTDDVADVDEVNEPAQEVDQTVSVDMKNFAFSTETISAAPGDTITVNLTTSSGSHDFVIDELGVASDTLGAGESDTVTFTIPEDAAGETYAFYCSIGNHRAQGMEGQLVITN